MSPTASVERQRHQAAQRGAGRRRPSSAPSPASAGPATTSCISGGEVSWRVVPVRERVGDPAASGRGGRPARRARRRGGRRRRPSRRRPGRRPRRRRCTWSRRGSSRRNRCGPPETSSAIPAAAAQRRRPRRAAARARAEPGGRRPRRSISATGTANEPVRALLLDPRVAARARRAARGSTRRPRARPSEADGRSIACEVLDGRRAGGLESGGTGPAG